MRRVGAVLLALVVLAVVSGALLGRLAPRLVAGRLSTTLGLPVEVGRVEAEWETRSLVLSRVEVRAHDGDALVRARSVVVGMAALAGAADAFDGATARGLVLPGLAAVDGSARRLRLQRQGAAIAVDGVFESGDTVVSITDGRLDPGTDTASARRVTVERLSLGDVVVERGMAEDVHAGDLPRRLRARLRIGNGAARLRWDAAAPRLDVRLSHVPMRLLLRESFRNGSLRGGVTSGIVRAGRRPGTIAARLRVGPMRLERDGETWLGWSALTADLGPFEVRDLRLVRANVAADGLIAFVRHDAGGTWPLAGWRGWLTTATLLRAGGLWAWIRGRFGAAGSDGGRPGRATVAVSTGTVTIVDATTEPPARLGLRDVDAYGRYEAGAGVEGRLDAGFGGGGSIAAVLEPDPVPRATVVVRGLPLLAVGGWRTIGRGPLGLPLGRMLELAGDGSTLDLALDVTGDPSQQYFGLSTRAVEALIETLRNRVTEPLLASAEVTQRGGVETLVLPALAVDASTLTDASTDTLDRLVVLLRQFPELGVGVEGRFGSAETETLGETRVAIVVGRLEDQGVANRIVAETVVPGEPGVGVALEQVP